MKTTKKVYTFILLLLVSISSCSKHDESPRNDLYFPANNRTIWETQSPASLGWNLSKIQALKDYLIQTRTKSFIILVNGRIAMEEYFDGHSATESWEWNSAGKTLVSATTGIAYHEGIISINNKVSDYLGTEWTNMPLNKENLITVRHLLTMTSGNDASKQYMIKSNLTYVADAGKQWDYSNIFQKLIDVVANAGNQPFETYFNEKLKNRIGMDGYWNFGLIYTIYHSTTRSMARFGLLALNNGNWGNEAIVNESFFKECTSTSQNINPAYGYLWWLNGKTIYMLPGGQTQYQGTLVPNAPSDMYAAMGANDQRIYVVPSKQMVVVRMGKASDPSNPSFAGSGFDDELWKKLNAVLN